MGSTTTIAAVAGAVLLAAGGVTIASAQAASSTATPAATPSATSTTAPATGDKAAAKATRKDVAGKRDGHRGLHAQWVTKDASGAFVTHRAITGAVTAVSPSSITVKAEDGVSETFVLSPQTKVRTGTAGKGTKPAPGQLADLKPGQQVMVAGTGTDPLTARHVFVKSG